MFLAAELGLGAAEEARLVSVLTLHLGRLAIAQVAADKGSSLLLDTSTLSTLWPPTRTSNSFSSG